MTKNPSFWVLSVLLLLSASFGVSSAHAADDYKFCVKGSASTGETKLYLGQYKTSESKPSEFDTYTCYDYWYYEDGGHNQEAGWIFDDAWSHISNWLDKHTNYAYIYVVSDLVFAGHSTTNGSTTCNEKDENNEQIKNAFMGKMLDLKAKYKATIEARTFDDKVLSSTDPFRKISGLCFITPSDTVAGFVRRLAYTYSGDNVDASIKNLWFDDAYFDANNPYLTEGTGVGIVASVFGDANTNFISNSGDTYGNSTIKVTNSEFHGGAAGAVFGKGGRRIPYAVVENVKVVGQKYAGGLVGYIDSTYVGDSVSIYGAKLSNVDVSVSESDGYAGGLIGYMANGYAPELIQLYIRKNFMRGDITGATGATLGFLIGGLNDSTKFNYYITVNYQFGTCFAD